MHSYKSRFLSPIPVQEFTVHKCYLGTMETLTAPPAQWRELLTEHHSGLGKSHSSLGLPISPPSCRLAFGSCTARLYQSVLSRFLDWGVTVQGWALLALTWPIIAQICDFWGCHLCTDPAAKSWVCIRPSSLHMNGSLFWPCNLTKLGLCRQISPHIYLFSSSRVKPYLNIQQKFLSMLGKAGRVI